MELDGLFTAATVSKDFRQRLLSDPTEALANGYNNQRFKLNPVERALVLSIRAETIEDFARQLHNRQDELPNATLPLVGRHNDKDDVERKTNAQLLKSCRNLVLDIAA
jgi:hypothetical protein